jgi:hypothetical protein
MDRVAEYREHIKRLLREREQRAQVALPENLEVRCFFDEERGQYALITLGWMKNRRVCGNTLFLTLRGQQIWVEEDRTDAPIADAGVAPEDIVLAFQPLNMRRNREMTAA